MFEETLIPLTLVECLGHMDGKTRFQKLVFLIQKEANSRGLSDIDLHFELYYYGPFSRQLSSVLSGLVKEGYLTLHIERTTKGYIKYVYSLTDAGMNLLERASEKRLIDTNLTHAIREVAEKYGSLELSELVNQAKSQF